MMLSQINCFNLRLFNRTAGIAVGRNGLGHEFPLNIKSNSSSFTSSTGGRSSSSYDVIVSGGGMVGASLAASFGHETTFRDKKILLLDESPKLNLMELPKEFSSRVCALNLSAKRFLSNFGAWDGIASRRFQQVKRMQVWDSCSESMIAFEQDSLEQDLAFIAENDIILAAIYDQLEKIKGQNVEVRFQTKVKSYKLPSSVSFTGSDSNWTLVELENGEVLRSKLVIGSDGYNSLLRSNAKIHTVQWNYKQMAVVATVHLIEDTINNVAWQRFLPDGPIALLPLSNEASCLIWSTSVERAKHLTQLSNESFVDAINNAFWSDDLKSPLAGSATQFIERIAQFAGLEQPVRQLPPTIMGVADGSRKMFPLGLMHATHYVKPRMALIGDAAHRVHPLAGQGVNLGFGDAACLTKVLTEAIYNGQDIGSLRHLLSYESERQRHIIPVLAGVDGLQRLYSTSFAPVVLLRSIGCQALNSVRFAKNFMIQFAN